MPRYDDIQHSIMIVSSSEKFAGIVKRSLAGFITIDVKKSVSSARRSILERDYDIVVIDIPLQDEPGEEFAIDISEKSRTQILLVVPQDVSEEVMENVSDYGIMVLPKPFPRGRVDKAIRFMAAINKKMRGLEKKSLSIQDKMEEIRIVSRAKLLLVEKKGMTEDDAHRYIGKCAMDNGVSRRKIAEKILEENE